MKKKFNISVSLDCRHPSEMTKNELLKEANKCLCIMHLEGKIDMNDIIFSPTHYNVDEVLLSNFQKKLH